MKAMQLAVKLGAIGLALALGAVALVLGRRRSTTWKQRIALLGLDVLGARKEMLVGLMIGGIAMTAVFVVELASGAAVPRRADDSPGPILGWAALLLVGVLVEEVLNRSFTIRGIEALTRSRGVAVLASAVLFGLVHAVNPEASTTSVASAMVGGIMYGLAFVQSGRIWMPVGVHASWNLLQGCVFGFSVSGQRFPSLLHIVTNDHRLSGGPYGPEAGAIGLLGRFLVIGLLLGWHALKRRRSATENPYRQERR
jgi:membrane protease YdiL (CAAX protease family)